jgi:SAM-dependent methyltransferase
VDAHNRRRWDQSAAAYEAQHARTLARHGGMAWGLWRIPEAQLHLLGDLTALAGRDVLEIGCGAARWSLALARRGARCTAVDLSLGMLAQSPAQARPHLRLRLVCAPAEALPLPDASADLVLSDWGALTWGDPVRVLPEVARVLRPGGRVVWCTGTPLLALCQHADGRLAATLQRPAAPVLHLGWNEARDYLPSDAEWLHLLRVSSLMLNDLRELRPAPRATSTFYGPEERAWARRWPMEQVWSARKEDRHGDPP